MLVEKAKVTTNKSRLVLGRTKAGLDIRFEKKPLFLFQKVKRIDFCEKVKRIDFCDRIQKRIGFCDKMS